MREFLDAKLYTGADVRLNEVESLPMLKVVSGTLREFNPPKRD
jgi:hypothetical protein